MQFGFEKLLKNGRRGRPAAFFCAAAKPGENKFVFIRRSGSADGTIE